MSELGSPVVETRACYRCEGKGESVVRLLFIDSRGRTLCRWDTLLCPDCGGLGMIPAEQSERWQAGRQMAADRKRRHVSQRQEAERLGITVKELSDREWGRF